MYAQQPYRDTLFMFNDKVYPCFVTDINESSIKFIYSNNAYESAILKSVSKIVLNNYGEVYNSEKGFLLSMDTLQNISESRWEKLVQEKKHEEQLEELNAEILQNDNSEINRWSFGVVYIPYSSRKTYYLNNSPVFGISVYSFINNETRMEGQFAYLVSPNLRLTFDIGYSLAFTEERDESHTTDGSYVFDSGTLNSRDLKLFNFNLGLKVYFKNFLEEKVTAYWLGGIGKQIAFGSTTNENLYTSQPAVINNDDEYLEELNSPWHFNVGFGAEYFFNKSLSLFSMMRFSYSIVSAEYKSTTFSGTQRTTSNIQSKDSEITTDFGLGLNFYF